MKIKWENIFGLLLLGFCIYLFFKLRPTLNRLFDDMNNGYSYGHYDHHSLAKIIIIGLICVSIVAIVKITSRKGNKNE